MCALLSFRSAALKLRSVIILFFEILCRPSSLILGKTIRCGPERLVLSFWTTFCFGFVRF